MRMVTTAIALLLGTFVQQPSSATSPLKVGILVPQDVYNSSVQEQIEAAANISREFLKSQGGADIEIEFLPGAYDKPGAALAAYKKLRDEGTNVIVGGMPGTNVAVLSAASAKFATPTIILGDEAGEVGSLVKDNILKLGVSASVAYAKNLRYWIDREKIKNLSVLYGGDDELEYKYGEVVTHKALQPLKEKPSYKFSDISAFGKLRPEFYDKVMRVPGTEGEAKSKMKMSPDGIVISSPFHDKLAVFSAFGKATAGVPVFIAPPVASTVEVGALAKRAKRTVYYSTPFWAGPEFVNAMKKKVELTSDQFVHPYAVAIHDAVKVAGTAWLGWASAGAASKVWTGGTIDRVKGAGGMLTLLEGQVMAGPIGLLAGKPDGKVSYVGSSPM